MDIIEKIREERDKAYKERGGDKMIKENNELFYRILRMLLYMLECDREDKDADKIIDIFIFALYDLIERRTITE